MKKNKKASPSNPPRREKYASYSPPSQAAKTKKGTITNPEIDSFKPRWAFRRMDWTFSLTLEARRCKAGASLSSNSPKIECCFHLLAESLKSYESQTWGEIRRNDVTGSHFISLESLEQKNSAAADRFRKFVIDDGMEQLFSLSLGSEERLWGIVLSDGTFEALWYDPRHKIWPTGPRNT